MNSLIIVFIAIISYWLGYKFYARRLEGLWQIDPQKQTPATTKFDGVDYIPAKNWLVLFGHHFASISGAGPIVGPVIAVGLWGWGPALIWVILGTIFIGGVHDFANLIISVREGGSSIADIATNAISRRAKVIFSLFVWLALILVIAVFLYLCADTFVKEPRIVIPSLGLIPVAVIFGFLIYNLRINIVIATIIGLAALVGLIFLGGKFPVTILNTQAAWSIVLLIYAYIASVIPVNILLQPRDYLSSFLLFFGLFFGFLGLLIERPVIQTAAFTGYRSASGDLWPMLFVVVACGAISGFHSLVASGTTSKQLPNEVQAKRIGYGGMVAEGLLAVMVILAISAGLSSVQLNDCFVNKISPVGVFGLGYGSITKSVLGGLGGFVAIIILNAFILTTLDTATRINRYITEELFKIKNRFISTFIIILAGGYLALSKDQFNTPLWQKIWPVFGASNQLVAALALLVVSCWLLARKKPTCYTLLPAIFMLITTIAAMLYQLSRYIQNSDYVLIGISIVLILLAAYLIKEVILVFRKVRKNVS
ncbi:MAG: carbon starvation protein A [Candidatus Omnitrophota bacterium]